MELNDSRVELLNSWKEIAQYLRRGTRTVQRWEHDLGLPVRRPRGKTRSAVIAFRTELDLWMDSSSRSDHHESPDPDHDPNHASGSQTMETRPLQEVILLSRSLRKQNRQLSQELSSALHSLVSSLRRIEEGRIQNGYLQ